MRCLAVGLVAALIAASAPAWSETCTQPEMTDPPLPRTVMVTDLGVIVIELCELDAPETVANFLSYVRDGSYTDDGFIHRSAASPAVIQGGGFYVEDAEPPYTRAVEAKDPIEQEITGLSNERGTIAMARTSDPDSATSQWFINVQDNPGLDLPSNYFSVFGTVEDGMDAVDAIWAVDICNLNPLFREIPVQNAHPCESVDVLDHVVYVPEPGHVLQLGVGASMLAALAGRRRRASRPD